tara:strand:- start:197 stop:910 length:714 start_codon:yes stop_codon:yes gene_type:complete
MNYDEDRKMADIRQQTRELNIRIFERKTGRKVCQMCSDQLEKLSDGRIKVGGKIYEKLPDGTWIVVKILKKVIDHLGYNDPKKCDKCGREDKVKYSDFSKDKYDKPGQIEYDMNMNKQFEDDECLENFRRLDEDCNNKKNEYVWRRTTDSIYEEFRDTAKEIIAEERYVMDDIPEARNDCLENEKERISQLCDKFEVIISSLQSDGRTVKKLWDLFNKIKNYKVLISKNGFYYEFNF